MTTGTLMLDIYILKHKGTNSSVLKSICNDLEYNYEKVKNSPLLYSDILKKRLIKYSIHQHIGYPHFYVSFEVDDDLFLSTFSLLFN